MTRFAQVTAAVGRARAHRDEPCARRCHAATRRLDASAHRGDNR
jgi:hypothetical protein